MLKKGFTLQELLITMGIVGIISALVIPGVVNMMPDKNKTMYMKVYNTLTSQTDEILSDSGLYYTTYNSTTGEESCTGLSCSETPVITPFANNEHCSGATKFGAILSERLNLKNEPTYEGKKVSFFTSDGISWELLTTTGPTSHGRPATIRRIDVTINLDPSDNSVSHNCLYSAACTKPNQFKFEIDNRGGVRAADALGIAYLQTPTDMHNSSNDRAFAERIYADTVDGMYTNLNEILKSSTTTTTES